MYIKMNICRTSYEQEVTCRKSFTSVNNILILRQITDAPAIAESARTTATIVLVST